MSGFKSGSAAPQLSLNLSEPQLSPAKWMRRGTNFLGLFGRLNKEMC